MKNLFLILILFAVGCAEKEFSEMSLVKEKYSCIFSDADDGRNPTEVWYRIDLTFKENYLENGTEEVLKVDYSESVEADKVVNTLWDLEYSEERPYSKIGNLVTFTYEHTITTTDEDSLSVETTTYKAENVFNTDTLKLRERYYTDDDPTQTDSTVQCQLLSPVQIESNS